MNKRILFVDDEANVLNGLRRMLRPMRDKWEMSFVSSGSEALDVLAKNPYDVVVSDMRMPGMDGVQLLAEVKKRYPRIVRIVLSGHSDNETNMNSVEVAHQYLSKPCQPDMLRLVVTRACNLRDQLTNESLISAVTNMTHLPSRPPLYMEIMKELQSPKCSIQRVGDIVSKDISMTAKILHLVNSAFFGLRSKVANIPHAVTLMGFNTVRNAVVSVSVFKAFKGKRAVSDFNITDFWTHALAVAVTSKHLGEDTRLVCPDECFLGGLIHDMGKVVLAHHYPDLFRRVWTASTTRNLSFHEAEKEELPMDHARIGSVLAKKWPT